VAGQQLSGTGTEATNHIHLDDVVEAIKFSHAHTLKGLYHLVNDDHPSRSELYGALCRQRGLPPPIWGAASDQGHVGGYKVCNCKIKAMGFTFGHPHLY
jgi:nucleoside-diphosphate-sugar epimerase